MRDKIEKNANYLPNLDHPPHRQLRDDEIDAEGDESNENIELNQESSGSSGQIILSKHKVKTYADLGFE